MTQTCPIMPRLEQLPFAFDRAAAWQAIRRAGDVAVSDEGAYFLIGADVVEAAAKNPQVFSSARAFDVVASPFPLVPIAADPPDHTRFRHLLDTFFSPRSVAAHEAGLRAQINVLVDEILAGETTVDVVGSLTVPFPSQVFLTLFGLPLDDRDRLVAWKTAIITLINTQGGQTDPRVVQTTTELLAYLTEHIAAPRDEQAGDLLSQLLVERGRSGMTDAEILGLSVLFVIAGLDTVTAALGFALHALALDPVLRTSVGSDPAAAAVFIEQILRLESPIPAVPRVTTADAEIGGMTIPSGSKCWLMLGAANRDPQRFDLADELGANRANHFGFGRGPHRCLGSHLARLEVRLVLEEWLRRIPEFTLAAEPEVLWPSATLTLKSLHLNLGSQAGSTQALDGRAVVGR